MNKTIIASALFLGLGCGGSSGIPQPTAANCTSSVVLSDEEISVNAGVLPAESCWLIDSNFSLDRTLTVKEGVIFEVAQGARLTVEKEGSLTIEGSEEKPVLFTGVEDTVGFWQGIEVESDSSANIFDHVIVEYAGSKKFTGADYTKGAIYVDEAQLSITNSHIRKNGGAAFIFVDDSTFTLENNEITGNEIAGIVGSDLVGQLSESNTWDANADPSVNIGVSTASSNLVSTDQTWLDIGTSFTIPKGIKITADLVLAPNTKFLMGQEAEISVEDDGSFNLVGSAEKPISFEGTDPSKGFWKGIQFDSKNSANVFDYVSIKHASGSDWTGTKDSSGSIYLKEESKLVMTHSEISLGGGFALTAREDGDISGFAANTIKDNGRALNLHAGQMASLNGDSIYENNTEPYISVTRGTIGVATLWKKQTTPFRFLDEVTIGADVQIEPGVVLEFGENGTISVDEDGSMTAEGTATDKIVFTGADKIAGFWKGIEFNSNSSQNILKHVEVSFGGSEKWNGGANTEGNIYIRKARVDISDSKISDSAGYGIVSNSNSEIANCANVDLSGNAKGEVYESSATLVSACP